MEKTDEVEIETDKFIYYGTTNGELSKIEIINIEPITPDSDQNRISTEELEDDNCYQSKLFLDIKKYS